MSKITSLQYAEALLQACTEVAPADQDRVIDRFLQIVQDQGDGNQLQDILNAFETLIANSPESWQASVRPEVYNDKQMLDVLNDEIKKKGKLSIVSDSEVVGGVVLRTSDIEIDNSVRGRLDTLYKNFSKTSHDR